jgi:hypothetical protein
MENPEADPVISVFFVLKCFTERRTASEMMILVNILVGIVVAAVSRPSHRSFRRPTVQELPGDAP